MSLKVLKWFARILPLAAIMVLLLFSLDSFGGDESFGRKILGFLMHNIPAILLIIALSVAWRYEIWGGVLFVLVAFGLVILFKSFAGNPASLIIIAPVLMSGLIFIVHGFLSAAGGNKAVT